MQKSKDYFFSTPWWEEFIVLWNASPYASELGGIGLICFNLKTKKRSEEILVNWDDTGQAAIIREQQEGAIKFSATRKNWLSFIRGDIKATDAVLDGKLKFEGRFSRITPYSLKFNYFSTVAKQML